MFKHTPANIVQTNRLPFLIGIVLLMVVMGVFMYKAQMNQKIQFIQSKPRQSIDISPRTAEAGWFNDERFKNIKINYASQLRKPTAQEVEAQKISQDMSSTQLEIKKMQDQNRIEEKKLELEAVKSPLNIEVPPPPGTKAVSQGKKSSKDGLTDRLNELMNMVQSATGAKLPTQINIQDGKQAFLKKPGGEDNYLENSKKKPRSPYEIKAGNYISAALITGINSDLPGSVNAQVTENVFDSITGNYLLIPQGAKLIGEYNSNLSFGQQRVQVVWNRIIFPDGASLDLGRMQGIDISGYTGYYDKVDNHYLRVYGSAVLLSLLGAGYDILNQQQEQSTDARASVAANVAQKLSDVSQQNLEKNMNVQPTLIINPGYKFKIMVMKDMVLENIENVEGTLSYTK